MTEFKVVQCQGALQGDRCGLFGCAWCFFFFQVICEHMLSPKKAKLQKGQRNRVNVGGRRVHGSRRCACPFPPQKLTKKVLLLHQTATVQLHCYTPHSQTSYTCLLCPWPTPSKLAPLMGAVAIGRCGKVSWSVNSPRKPSEWCTNEYVYI